MDLSYGIIIPFYNDSRFVSGAIESCFQDAHKPLELIVVDDGSSEEEGAALISICERAEQNHGVPIYQIRKERNEGVICAMNDGLRVTRADFAVFRAADDKCSKGFFDRAIAVLSLHPDSGLCVGDICYSSSGDASLVRERLLAEDDGYYTPEQWGERLSGSNIVHSATAMFNVKRLRKLGGFDRASDLYHDWWTCHQMVFRYGAVYVGHPGAVFLLRSDSVSTVEYRKRERAQKSYEAVRMLLKKESDRVRAEFERSGLLSFFSSLDGVEHSQNVSSVESGIGAVLRERLSRFEERFFEGFEGIVFYGAGNHTRSLLHEWERLGLPLPDGLLVSGESGGATFEGMPIWRIDTFPAEWRGLVVLSSKSFESDMFEACCAHLPEAAILSFWNPSLTRLGDSLSR